MMSLSRKKYQKIGKFLEFDMRKECVDEFLSAYAGTCPEYKDI